MTRSVLQSCGACRRSWQFRRAACPACASLSVTEVTAGGKGTIWSVTTVLRAPLPELDVPGGYGIALVTLDEGPRIMCRAEPGLAIGDRVRVSLGDDGLLRAERP